MSAVGESRPFGWVVVRQTISTGQRWYIAEAGQYCSRDIKKAVVHAERKDAEYVVRMEQRDLDCGRGRGGFRVWAEQIGGPT